jgi:hypothetical protein
MPSGDNNQGAISVEISHLILLFKKKLDEMAEL